jgi:hypothetical protein
MTTEQRRLAAILVADVVGGHVATLRPGRKPRA